MLAGTQLVRGWFGWREPDLSRLKEGRGSGQLFLCRFAHSTGQQLLGICDRTVARIAVGGSAGRYLVVGRHTACVTWQARPPDYQYQSRSAQKAKNQSHQERRFESHVKKRCKIASTHRVRQICSGHQGKPRAPSLPGRDAAAELREALGADLRGFVAMVRAGGYG